MKNIISFVVIVLTAILVNNLPSREVSAHGAVLPELPTVAAVEVIQATTPAAETETTTRAAATPDSISPATFAAIERVKASLSFKAPVVLLTPAED